MTAPRAHYSGPSRKLVVAFDIGTTFSGAAYAFLDPGQFPQIRSVTRYLNNPNPGSAKIPSTLYYDHDGNFCGVENGDDFQDSDEFVRMKWWKLMLSPSDLSAAMVDQMSMELPKGKTIVDVFADFLRYLYDSTEALFKSSEPNVKWDSISVIELVLTHPNGWKGPQQSQLRTAAVKAGLIQDTPAEHARVHFVSEGEASFGFCVTNTQAGEKLKPGEQALVIDAGGGTIDISTYKVLTNGPLRVEELYEPQCIVQGGELVTVRATEMIKEKLKDSKYNTRDDLATFSQRFEEGVKKVFSTSNRHANQYIKFGSPRDNEPNVGIKAGRLALTGAEVSEFFEPSIQATVDSIRDNFTQRLPTNSFAFLVGGFAINPWLSEQLEKRLMDLGFRFSKPDTHTNKAVAIGAVSYYIDRFVTGRISKFTYGVLGDIGYDPSNPEHVRREHQSYIDPMGDKYIPNHFDTMLTRGTKVLEDREIRLTRTRTSEGAPQKRSASKITKYTGALAAPKWKDVEPDKFQSLCHIRADITGARYTSKLRETGVMVYRRRYTLILLVGLTELKAQVSWIDSETGKEKRSDAMVVYDDPPYPVNNRASGSEPEQAQASGLAESPVEPPAESPEVVHNSSDGNSLAKQ